MRCILRALAALAFFVTSGVAEAHCRDTEPVLEITGDLARFVANLRNAVEHVAPGTLADEDLRVLRVQVEGFYDLVYAARSSCNRIRQDFARIEHLGEATVAQIEAQDLMEDNDVSGQTIGMRLVFVRARGLVDDL